MVFMEQEAAMEYRVNKAIEVGENFVELHTSRLLLIKHNYGKPFMFSPNYFKIWNYTRQVTKFEIELIKIVDSLKTSVAFMDKYEWIWELNDHIEFNKELLINYYNFSGKHEDNEGEAIFNVYTYGGKI